MKLTITAKQIGRKHSLIEKKVIEIEDIGLNPTIHDLITAVVTQQVHAYHARSQGKSILPFLSNTAVDDQAANGKVSFGAIYNESKPDINKAVETAIRALEDGIFTVFAGDVQFNKTDEIISLKPDTVITFIRLTFLAGSYW